MKQIVKIGHLNRIFFMCLVSLGLSGLISCGESHTDIPDINNQQTKEIILSGDAPFVYDLYVNTIPVEGGFTIDEQAEHAIRSEIATNIINDTLRLQYIYQAEAGFSGVDQVVLKECISYGAECVSLNFCTFVFTVE